MMFNEIYPFLDPSQPIQQQLEEAEYIDIIYQLNEFFV